MGRRSSRWFRPEQTLSLTPHHPSNYPRRMGRLVRKGGAHQQKMGSLGGLWGQGGPLRPRRETSSAVAPSCDLFCIIWCVIPVMRACHIRDRPRDMCDGCCWRLSHTCDTYHPLPPSLTALVRTRLWLSGIIINWTLVFLSFRIELNSVELNCPEWNCTVAARCSGSFLM